MKLAIIADDLTGANDSGVQLAKYGLMTSVLLKEDPASLMKSDAVVFDTNSRAMAADEAQQRIETITKFLVENGYKHIYKKIDSTLRGNVGKEIIGFHNQLQTDFIFLAVAFPKNGRKVMNGNHYLNGQLLSETEIANDPICPVRESHIPSLLAEQTNEKVGLIDLDVLRAGKNAILKKLQDYKKDNIRFVVIDSEVEEDLQLLLESTKDFAYTIGWVGSAGLANYLPAFLGIEQKANELVIPDQKKPILTVVGSVNINSRRQLNILLKEDNVLGIQMASYKAVSDEFQNEVKRVCQIAKQAAKQGKHVAIYTAGEDDDIAQAREAGQANGYNHIETSKKIVNMLGIAATRLLEENLFQGVVMTGGDTAKSICDEWNVAGFNLYDELEVGVPISSFIGNDHFFAITKAGGFGRDNVLIDAIKRLKGDVVHES